jgi:ferredoxin
MLTIRITDRAGETHRVSVEARGSLMECLRTLGLVDAICGGGASCGTCLVRLRPSWSERLPASDEIERLLLEGLESQPGERLSCQIMLSDLLDGLELAVADSR